MVAGYTRVGSHEHVERDERAPFTAELVSPRIRHSSFVPPPATYPISDSCAAQLPRPPTWKTRRRLRAGLIGLASAIACALTTGAVGFTSRRRVQADQAAVASTYDAKESKATTLRATQFDTKRCADSNGEGCLPLGKREVRDLIHDCARGLEVPKGDDCSEEPIGNSYRVPFMRTTRDLPCNFEVCYYEYE